MIDPGKEQTFCVDGDHNISHIEFADCPSVDKLTADCFTLTVDTGGLSAGTEIDITFQLDLAGIESAVYGPVTVTRAVDADGIATVDLTGLADDSWDQVTVSDVSVTSSGFDLLSGTETVSTGRLCNPPDATARADCDNVCVTPNGPASDDGLAVTVNALYNGSTTDESATVTFSPSDLSAATESCKAHGFVDSFDAVSLEVNDNTVTDENPIYTNASQEIAGVDLCNPPAATVDVDCIDVCVTPNGPASDDTIEVSVQAMYNGEPTDESTTLTFDSTDLTADTATCKAHGFVDSFDAVSYEANDLDVTEGSPLDEATNEAIDDLCNPPAATVDVDCVDVCVTPNGPASDDTLEVQVDARLLGGLTGESSTLTFNSSELTADTATCKAHGFVESFDTVDYGLDDLDVTEENSLDTATGEPIAELGEGEVCNPPDATVTIDCDNVYLSDPNSVIQNDTVTIDVTVTDLSDTTVSETVSASINLTDQTFPVAYNYAADLTDVDTWDEALVSVLDITTNTQIDGTPKTLATPESCGCPPCPSDLAVKFEGGEIREGYSEGGFTITLVDNENDPKSVCFTSDTLYCELKVCVKAGQHTGSTIVEPSDGEYCFTVADATGQDQNAISHFTIRCPETDCVFTGPGSA